MDAEPARAGIEQDSARGLASASRVPIGLRREWVGACRWSWRLVCSSKLPDISEPGSKWVERTAWASAWHWRRMPKPASWYASEDGAAWYCMMRCWVRWKSSMISAIRIARASLTAAG